jgi:hypothetical protein
MWSYTLQRVSSIHALTTLIVCRIIIPECVFWNGKQCHATKSLIPKKR